MIIEVDGLQYAGWTDANAKIRLDSLANTFEFNATSANAKPLPFKGGEACKIFVDGEKVITGHIELVNVDGDSTSHDISITGRGNTGDVLDSRIGSLSDIRSTVSLKSIIEKILKHIGSDVKVIEEFTPAIFTESEDLAAPEPGQDVWDFIQSLARKRQVLLSSNADGNILIARSSGEEIDAFIQHKVADDTNNVLSYNVSYDTTGRYNVYRISSQLNPVALIASGSSKNTSIVNQSSQVIDDLIREGRQYVLSSENAGSNPIERAKWEMNVRRARGKIYSATVHGFRNQDGKLWQVNKLPQITDDFAGINSRMLINAIQFSIGDSGRITNLSFVEKDAFTLTLDPPKKVHAAADVVGDGLTDEQKQLMALGLLWPALPEDETVYPEWKPFIAKDKFGPRE